MSMRVVVRAYNADGYTKDIAYLSENYQGATMHEARVERIVHGVSVIPKDFPEMVRFEIVLEESRY